MTAKSTNKKALWLKRVLTSFSFLVFFICFNLQCKIYLPKYLQSKTTTTTETENYPCIPLPYMAVCPGYKRGTFEKGKNIWYMENDQEFIRDPEGWWGEHTLDLEEGLTWIS